MDSDDMLACYEALARLAVDALTAAETRDWEAFSRQQEREAARYALAHDPELPVVESRDPPHVSHIATHQRKVVVLTGIKITEIGKTRKRVGMALSI